MSAQQIFTSVATTVTVLMQSVAISVNATMVMREMETTAVSIYEDSYTRCRVSYTTKGYTFVYVYVYHVPKIMLT